MRQRFDAQLRIGSTPISEIIIPLNSRDEFPPYLRTVQEIYKDSALSGEVLDLVENAVCIKNSNDGRPGMTLWSIFVLAGTRMCLKTDYDRVHYLSTNDILLRQMIGFSDTFIKDEEISCQTIKDNVGLLNDETLKKINDVVLKLGHRLFKKDENEELFFKTDSFVTESNVHFPTDYNLLWDSLRKSLDMIRKLILNDPTIEGWRKVNNWRKECKTFHLKVARAQASKGKGKEERVAKAVNDYLEAARKLTSKIENFVMQNDFNYEKQESTLLNLMYFHGMAFKHIDLVHRRLILNETIPTHEKIFSIFETYTEWITKGKMRPNVELGKRVNVTTDQFHLIVDCEISDHTADVDMLLPLVDRLISKYKVKGLSADKGYFKKEYKELIALFIPQVIIPKKGKLSASEKEEESDPLFFNARQKHSAIESNINELENRGLGRCKDKGYDGFKEYIGVGVMAYNMKRIGEHLLKLDRGLQQQSA